MIGPSAASFSSSSSSSSSEFPSSNVDLHPLIVLDLPLVDVFLRYKSAETRDDAVTRNTLGKPPREPLSVFRIQSASLDT
ncbi:hypothetical protein NMY22_g16314 [Coprinellus aureogranulatus]|nr:hypothetical protein NMY22_g16314 [Coprinellus aureogranulatus]